MVRMPKDFWSRLAGELEALKEAQQDILSDVEKGKYDDTMDRADIDLTLKEGREREAWLAAAQEYAEDGASRS